MTDSPRPLVAGNWKMNALRADAVALARDLVARLGEGNAPRCEVVLCPPATVLVEVAAA